MRIPASSSIVFCAMLLCTGCATILPPQPPSLQLPKPPSDLRATRKGDRVTLTWSIPAITTDRQTIKSQGATRICRGLAELTQCGIPVGEAPPQPVAAQPSGKKAVASYVATLPVQIESDAPSGFAVYAVEALNPDGRGAGLSNQIRVAAVRTIPSPPDFDARVTGAGVVLEWTSNVSPGISSPSVHFVYRVYRSEVGRTERILVGEVPAGGDRALTLSDSSLVWEKTYEYRVDTVTVIAQENKPHIEVEGDDSPAIKVLAHDVFPPAVPSGLQAVFSGPGQQSFIDLIWAPVSDVDLDGYNVYRHEEGTAPVKINTALLKTPAYRDSIVAAGRHYSYSVSAVDVRGNESARSEEAEEHVP